MNVEPYRPLLDLTVSFQNSPKYLDEIPVGQFKTPRATRPFKQIDLKVKFFLLQQRYAFQVPRWNRQPWNEQVQTDESSTVSCLFPIQMTVLCTLFTYRSFFTRDIVWSHDPNLQTSGYLTSRNQTTYFCQKQGPSWSQFLISLA